MLNYLNYNKKAVIYEQYTVHTENTAGRWNPVTSTFSLAELER